MAVWVVSRVWLSWIMLRRAFVYIPVFRVYDFKGLSCFVATWNWSALEESLVSLLPGHRGKWWTFLLKPLAEVFSPDSLPWSCPLWNNHFEFLFFKVLAFLLISNAKSRSIQEKKTKDSNLVLSCETVSSGTAQRLPWCKGWTPWHWRCLPSLRLCMVMRYFKGRSRNPATLLFLDFRLSDNLSTALPYSIAYCILVIGLRPSSDWLGPLQVKGPDGIFIFLVPRKHSALHVVESLLEFFPQ